MGSANMNGYVVLLLAIPPEPMVNVKYEDNALEKEVRKSELRFC